MMFQAQLIRCYVTCIIRKTVLASRRLLSDTKLENHGSFTQDPDINHCTDLISIHLKESWELLKKETSVQQLIYQINTPAPLFLKICMTIYHLLRKQ